MNQTYSTEQELFWASTFGDDYLARNQGQNLLASNLHFFSRSLANAGKISSCIEFGANIGMNLSALQLLYPGVHLSGIEIHDTAAAQLAKVIGEANVLKGSILELDNISPAQLVLIKGVLIHINPDKLNEVYDKLFNASLQYILIAEYYNPKPVAINYRGHENKLFKRDFAGEIMSRHSSLSLADYGFVYHKDPAFPQDDITWFLLKKS